jgi:hypothetical protein
MQDLHEHRWQYSHFGGVWEKASGNDRVIFCPDCRAVTSAAVQHCNGCGAEHVDSYRLG